jgi:hypothetical protein
VEAAVVLGLIVLLAVAGALFGADSRVHCHSRDRGDVAARYWWPNG